MFDGFVTTKPFRRGFPPGQRGRNHGPRRRGIHSNTAASALIGLFDAISHGAVANENRDWRIWEDLAKSLMRKAWPLCPGEDLGIELDITIYAMDSSTIDLSRALFPWADFRQTKAGIKMHAQIGMRGPIPTCIHGAG